MLHIKIVNKKEKLLHEIPIHIYKESFYKHFFKRTNIM